MKKGAYHSEEAKRKMGLTHRGKLGYWIGKSFSKEHKRKISETVRQQWQDPTYRRKNLINRSKPYFSEEAKKRISESAKGKPPWNKGKRLPKEMKLKIGLAHKGKLHSDKTRRKMSEVHKKLFQNKEYKEKRIKATLKGLMKRPTSFEQRIIDLCDKYSLPFKYVGDGKVLIDYKNPDFIENNGKKLLIEVYCKFWKLLGYEQKRSSIFSRYGYKTLFLSDDDILNDNWEDVCLNKITNFLSEK